MFAVVATTKPLVVFLQVLLVVSGASDDTTCSSGECKDASDAQVLLQSKVKVDDLQDLTVANQPVDTGALFQRAHADHAFKSLDKTVETKWNPFDAIMDAFNEIKGLVEGIYDSTLGHIYENTVGKVYDASVGKVMEQVRKHAGVLSKVTGGHLPVNIPADPNPKNMAEYHPAVQGYKRAVDGFDKAMAIANVITKNMPNVAKSGNWDLREIRWAKHPDKCLDIDGTGEGTRLRIWSCDDGKAENQLFVTPKPGSAGSLLVGRSPNKCISADEETDLRDGQIPKLRNGADLEIPKAKMTKQLYGAYSYNGMEWSSESQCLTFLDKWDEGDYEQGDLWRSMATYFRMPQRDQAGNIQICKNVVKEECKTFSTGMMVNKKCQNVVVGEDCKCIYPGGLMALFGEGGGNIQAGQCKTGPDMGFVVVAPGTVGLIEGYADVKKCFDVGSNMKLTLSDCVAGHRDMMFMVPAPSVVGPIRLARDPSQCLHVAGSGSAIVLGNCEAKGPYSLVKSNAECLSPDDWMGKKSSVDECANAVKLAGGRFFVFGKSSKAGNCYRENTAADSCPEGWETDDFDFYKMEGPPQGSAGQYMFVMKETGNPRVIHLANDVSKCFHVNGNGIELAECHPQRQNQEFVVPTFR